MKIKRWLSVMILAAWLTGTAVHGQQYSTQPIFPAPAPLAPNATPDRPVEWLAPSVTGLSDWLQYKRDCCEGKQGRYTPLYTELYLNAGPSFPVGGTTLSRELKPGWSITGGTRALFFNAPQTSAWVVDIHLINTNESAGRLNTAFPVTFFHNGQKSSDVLFQGNTGRTNFSLQNVNRTMLGLGFGREWYVWQPATSDGCMWRFGTDAGGRWGSQRVNFNEFGHITDVVGAMYAALHSDVEYPWHACLFHAGFRVEWSYIWSDVLQRTSDSQDVSLLFSAGVRY